MHEHVYSQFTTLVEVGYMVSYEPLGGPPPLENP